MKKLVCVLLVLVAGAGLVFAAGQRQSAAEADGPVRLVIWGGVPAENGPQAVVDNFNALHPHIRAEYVRYVNNDEGNARLDTALLAGEQIDLFVTYSAGRREQRIAGGFALRLNDLMDQFNVDLAEFFGQGIAEQFIRADGSVYSIPTFLQLQLVIANRDALESIGVELPVEPGSWSWDDFVDVASRLQSEAGFEYGAFFQDQHQFWIDQYVRTTTADRDIWLNREGTQSRWLDEPLLREALQWKYDAMHVHGVIPTLETIISDGLAGQHPSMLLDGRAGIVVDGIHRMRDIRNLQDFPRDFQVTLLPVPQADMSVQYAAPLVSNDEFKINANTANPEAAMEFLHWYITEGYTPMIVGGRTPLFNDFPVDAILDAIAVDGSLPDGREVFDEQSYIDLVLGDYPRVIVAGPDTARAEITAVINEEVEAFLLRLQSIDATLQNLHQRTQAALDRANS